MVRDRLFSLRSLTVACSALAVIFALPAVASADEVPLGSVAPQYRPTAGPEMPEPVSMQGYQFQVDTETGRVQVVVRYTYPDQTAFGSDGGVGPAPTRVVVIGLQYDANSHTVIFNEGGHKTVCGTVQDHHLLWHKTLAVTPTGACTVRATLTDHKVDTGWNINRAQTIDTVFEVR